MMMTNDWCGDRKRQEMFGCSSGSASWRCCSLLLMNDFLQHCKLQHLQIELQDCIRVPTKTAVSDLWMEGKDVNGTLRVYVPGTDDATTINHFWDNCFNAREEEYLEQ